MNWNRGYDRFLAISAWFNALIYATPAAVLLAACWHFRIEDRFWVPLLLIYLIGAVAHLLGHGIMAVNIQIKTSADYATSQMVMLADALQKQRDS